MDLLTISQVSKSLNVSTRTLRYYEAQGLIDSISVEDYAYRMYDDATYEKLEMILLLRKLTFSLKEIQGILKSDSKALIKDIFKSKLKDVKLEKDMLITIEKILARVVNNKNEYELLSLKEKPVYDLIQDTTFVEKTLKERKVMKEEKKKYLSVIKNPRVIFLPPMTVASSASGICENPEDVASEQLNNFIQEKKLYDLKPDFRVFGFNNPNPDETGKHGYEFYVSIPDDLEVSAALSKKTFEGGLYVAHCIKMGDFHEWQMFGEWLQDNEEYVYDNRPPEGMNGTLEEHLNAYSFYKNKEENFIQLDLLIPVKKK